MYDPNSDDSVFDNYDDGQDCDDFDFNDYNDGQDCDDFDFNDYNDSLDYSDQASKPNLPDPLSNQDRDVDDLLRRFKYLKSWALKHGYKDEDESTLGPEPAAENDLTENPNQTAPISQTNVEREPGASATSPSKTVSDPFDIKLIDKTDKESIFLWSINFQHIRELKTPDSSLWISSPPFYSSEHGYKFQLQISVVGETLKPGGNLRLLMHLLGGDYDEGLPWPMMQEITIGIHGLKDSFVEIEREEEEAWTKPSGPINPKLFYKADFIEISKFENFNEENVKIEIRFRNPFKIFSREASVGCNYSKLQFKLKLFLHGEENTLGLIRFLEKKFHETIPRRRKDHILKSVDNLWNYLEHKEFIRDCDVENLKSLFLLADNYEAVRYTEEYEKCLPYKDSEF